MFEFNDVFISYGRKESKAFATFLHNFLVENNYTVWFDQNDIPLAVDFQNQIDVGIEKADNFLFIIAPHSVMSPYCLKEVELAIKYNKRIIPILHIEPQSKEVWDKMHPVIGKINWLYMRQKADMTIPLDKWTNIDDFHTALNGLLGILGSHKEYLNTHTQILAKALDWNRNDRTPKYLLKGQTRLEAEKWMQTVFKNEQAPTTPTDLQCEFICESKEFAFQRMSDVFFCYADADENIVTKLHYAFMRKGTTTWTKQTDVKAGDNIEEVARFGIETNSFVIYIISEKTINSDFCTRMLLYAIELNKNIIPVQVEELSEMLLPKVIQKFSKIKITSFNEEDINKGFGIIYNRIIKDKDYYFQHKFLLVEALKWKRQNQPDSMLLMEYNLQAAESWLQLGRMRSTHKPTKIHEEYIKKSALKKGQLTTNLHISCSFPDSDFGRLLNEELQTNGIITWYAQENLEVVQDFLSETTSYIKKAENFLFIFSRQTISDEHQLKELKIAKDFNKRILVAFLETSDFKKPDFLSYKFEYFNFSDYFSNFNNSFGDLITALEYKKEYVAMHCIILDAALEWKNNQKDQSLLLVGKPRIDAVKWLAESNSTINLPCEPTDIMCQYICESVKNVKNQMTEVFLCYAYEDVVIRDEIQKKLTRKGITTADNTTIKTGVAFQTAIMKSIEKADNFLFFYSPRSIEADYCLEELSHAILFDKRIIIVEVLPANDELLLEELKPLSRINFTESRDVTQFDKAFEELLSNIYRDKNYFETHKILLAKAFNWKRQKSNPSLLLRGFELQNAEAWLKMGKRRDNHNPTPLQEQYVLQSSKSRTNLNSDVFISYDEGDYDFCCVINDLLQTHAKTTWFDQQFIAESNERKAYIFQGIETADNFLFIISPQSVFSQNCLAELTHAKKLNKRIIPIFYENVKQNLLPPEIKSVEWIDFRLKGKHFQNAFSDLLREVDTDREYIHNHTKWLQKAMEWESYKFDNDFLLRGVEIQLAQAWLDNARLESKEPKPSELQMKFIAQSREEDIKRQIEMERQRKLELLQVEREKNVAEDFAKKIQTLKEIAERKAEEQRILAERYNKEITLLKATIEQQNLKIKFLEEELDNGQ